MIEYTEEDNQLLEAMLQEAYQTETMRALNKSLNGVIGVRNTHDIIDDLVVGPLSKELAQIQEKMEKLAPWTLKRIKCAPLDQIPLLVNDSDTSIRTAALWRLKIGK